MTVRAAFSRPLRRRCFRFAAVGAFLPAFVAALLFPAAALPHGVYIFAWPDGERLCAESYFSRSSKVRGGEVTVRDARGVALFSGVSDDSGLVCFPAPEQARELRFIVSAGQGHRAEFVLPESSVAEAVAASAGKAAPGGADAAASADGPKPLAGAAKTLSLASDASSASGTPVGEAALAGGPAAFERRLREAVREEVRQELAPLRKALAERHSEAAPGIRDIVGGLGWIAGLAGFGALYASRRKKS